MKAPLQRELAVEKALFIQGWMLKEELEKLYDWASEMDSIVEVGSWKGRSTYVLCQGTKGTVTAVDTFKGSANDAEHLRMVALAGGSTFQEFMRNMAGCENLSVFQKDSLDAAAIHPDVDMVFIDAGHSYEEVLADLKAWKPRARKLICGHDMHFESVRRAVKEVLGDVQAGACGSLWWKQIPAVKSVPLFSILHTSARPEKWRAVYDDWMAKAVHPEDVEYVLCVDPRWGFEMDPAKYATPLDNVHVVVNNLRRCYVDGVNIAAKASTGSILIVNADDQFPCEKWDIQLDGTAIRAAKDAFVLEVSTGTPDEHERGIMVMPILSRRWYEKQGFVFYPEYESMFADNDFCESARQDNVVIDARHLMFPHRHPMFVNGRWSEDWKERADTALLAQNRPQSYEIGAEVYKRRKALGFPPMQHPIKKRTIALCLSGERFEGIWVDFMLTLYGHLIERDFNILRIRVATPNVYITRDTIRRTIMNHGTWPDLCLWLDDDNPLSTAHFDMLLAGLDAHPEVDGVAGWCWIHNEHKAGFMASCGEWAPDHLHWNPFPPSLEHERGLKPFDTGGLPCMLMRFSALEKAGESCFFPVVDRRLEHGMSGEDMAFFLAAEKGGAKFLVDPQVRVPHLKYVEVNPVFPEEGKVAVKVACMMRVKNEARWIKHTIDSVRELCGDLIYVMEDGSTDDTREIALAAGAIVFDSPFVGQGLDEARDKNWFMDKVIARCHPDWILMPDGDEELEAGGCAKIRRALESNPPCDAFALRFLYFWDKIDQIRLDGVYGTMARQSLFRANSEFRFKSYYSTDQTGNQNHVGLHTSNAPGLGGVVLPLNVALFHYGYLHREDRIRKFAWIIGIDPHNEGEGFYLHCVQGDIPEVPADAELKHSGPLRLQTLPARLVPKFDEVPGPAFRNILDSASQARQYAWDKMGRPTIDEQYDSAASSAD